MKAPFLLRNALIVAILALNTGCDQLSKSIVRDQIDFSQQINYLSGYLTLTRVENTGAFLSMGGEWAVPVRQAVLVGLPMLVLVLTTVWLLFNSEVPKLTTLGITCIVGGGLGNLYDRFIYGSVTDFVHIDLPLFNTGIFNFADVSITLGTSLIIIEFLRSLWAEKMSA